jgi:hypothetical protein
VVYSSNIAYVPIFFALAKCPYNKFYNMFICLMGNCKYEEKMYSTTAQISDIAPDHAVLHLLQCLVK